MEPTDPAIQILQSIRDEIREMRTELSARLDETNVRLHEVKTELARRIVESEVRTTAALGELTGAVREQALKRRGGG